jgi:hypothetical protein
MEKALSCQSNIIRVCISQGSWLQKQKPTLYFKQEENLLEAQRLSGLLENHI